MVFTHMNESQQPVHNCIHGQLQGRRSEIVVGHQNYLTTEQSSWGSGSTSPVNNFSVQQAEPKTSQVLPTADWKNIRIKIIDDTLYHDPGHTCFSTGQDYWDQGERKTCSWSQVLTPAKRDTLAKKLIPQAVSFFQQLLRVRPLQDRLRLRSFNCGFDGGVAVPGWLREEGVAADIVIFLSARPISMSETVAFAGHCEADQLGRPVAAHFNWSPTQLYTPADRFTEQFLVSVAMHEMTHALVFSPDLLAAFPR